MKSLCIYNPKSGKGKAENYLDTIEKHLKEKYQTVDFYKIISLEHLNDFIFKEANSYELIVILGGDGTIHTVFNALMLVEKSKRPRVLILPYGTSNDLAALFNMPKKLTEQLALINEDNLDSINIVKINDEYFVYAAALGKFTKVSYSVNRRYLKVFGYIMYLISMIPDLFCSYKMDLTLEVKDKVINTKSNLVLILAGYRTGGFNLKRLSNTPFCKDELSIVVFKRRWFLSWIKFLYFYLSNGKLTKHDYHICTNHAKIKTNSNKRWNIDGEGGITGDAEVTLINNAIDVYKRGKNE